MIFYLQVDLLGLGIGLPPGGMDIVSTQKTVPPPASSNANALSGISLAPAPGSQPPQQQQQQTHQQPQKSSEEEDFFNNGSVSASSAAADAGQDSGKMSKDSIMALFGKAPAATPAPAAVAGNGAFGGVNGNNNTNSAALAGLFSQPPAQQQQSMFNMNGTTAPAGKQSGCHTSLPDAITVLLFQVTASA